MTIIDKAQITGSALLSNTPSQRQVSSRPICC